MRLTYSQRLLVALLNIDKYNNIVNNTKEYKLIKRKDKTKISLLLSLSLSLSLSLPLLKVIIIDNNKVRIWEDQMNQ
jgi:uncharacterized membrane protein YbaN (DUF454 family)